MKAPLVLLCLLLNLHFSTQTSNTQTQGYGTNLPSASLLRQQGLGLRDTVRNSILKDVDEAMKREFASSLGSINSQIGLGYADNGYGAYGSSDLQANSTLGSPQTVQGNPSYTPYYYLNGAATTGQGVVNYGVAGNKYGGGNQVPKV